MILQQYWPTAAKLFSCTLSSIHDKSDHTQSVLIACHPESVVEPDSTWRAITIDRPESVVEPVYMTRNHNRSSRVSSRACLHDTQSQ